MSTCQQTYKWWLPKVSAAAGLNPNFPNQDTNFCICDFGSQTNKMSLYWVKHLTAEFIRVADRAGCLPVSTGQTEVHRHTVWRNCNSGMASIPE